MGAQLIFRVDLFIDSVIQKYEEVEKDKFDLSKIFLLIPCFWMNNIKYYKPLTERKLTIQMSIQK